MYPLQPWKSNKHYILWVCVSILVLVIWHTKPIFSMQHCIVICGLSGSTIFFTLAWLSKKNFKYTMCFDFLDNFCVKHLILRRYHKCTPNFMWSISYSCQILMKLEYAQQNFKKCSYNKFSKNPSNGCRDVPFGWKDGQTETFKVANNCSSPIQAASWSKARLCGHSLAGMWVQIPPQACMSASCECHVLTGGGFCIRLFICPEEPYCMWCVSVWSRGLDNDEGLARKGRADEPMAHMPNMADSIHCCSNFLKFILFNQPL